MCHGQECKKTECWRDHLLLYLDFNKNDNRKSEDDSDSIF